MPLLTILTLLLILLSAQGRLQQVVSMFRHGSRYYLHHYYDANDTLWGQLTAVGMRQHQSLGKALRNDYIHKMGFLSDSYDSQEMRVYSTDKNRTHLSAISQLLGMYPLGTGIQLTSGVDRKYHLPPYSNSIDTAEERYAMPEGYQEIPIVQDPQVLPLDCPLSGQLMSRNENMQMETYKEMNLTYYPFMKKMGNLFQFKTLNFSAMIGLYDTLAVDDSLGRPMPSGFTREDYLNLQHLTSWYSLFRNTFNLSRALNTNVLRRVITDFDNRINNRQQLKWTSLSAHDTNLFAMINDLNITSAACIEELYRKGSTEALNCREGPQYAASLIFELYSLEEGLQGHYVKIRYNGEYVNMCGRRQKGCDYEEWRQVAQQVMISNTREVCFGKEGYSAGNSHLYD